VGRGSGLGLDNPPLTRRGDIYVKVAAMTETTRTRPNVAVTSRPAVTVMREAMQGGKVTVTLPPSRLWDEHRSPLDVSVTQPC
jgi:hypothetical protein